MNADEIKAMREYASKRTGVPAELITGETSEEIANSALTLLEMRRKSYENAPAREKFIAWYDGTTPVEFVPDPAINNSGYPIVPDPGEPTGKHKDTRSAREQFNEWFLGVTAFNPKKDSGKW